MISSIGEAGSDTKTAEQSTRFDYAALDLQTARAIRVSAERIRQLIRRSLDDVIEIGTMLISVKQTLRHGEFQPWLHCEFGWKERSARNFMNVAQRFKSARVADLEVDVTAAYLLAAPSTPERARTMALERAEDGQHITHALAREIITKTKAEHENSQPNRNGTHAGERAIQALDRLRRHWPGEKAQKLAQLLRAYADSLEDASKHGARH